MANSKHVEIVKRGCEAVEEFRSQNPYIELDLSGADFTDMDLGRANLQEANLRKARLARSRVIHTFLRGAKLSEAFLHTADFRDADLREADLSDANLIEANFDSADLGGADLRRSLMLGTNFRRANLRQTNFSGAVCSRTLFGGVDLSAAIGLELIVHEGPSTIGVDVLFKSSGNLSEVFLRGCGVPEVQITYLHSLTSKAFEYYTCFISFTESADMFSERLYNDLQGGGVRCWRWKEDAKWGRTLMREVDQAIRSYDKLVVILSEHSLNAEPVVREIERALQKEQREGKEVLFPIRLDDYVFSWSHELQADVLRKTIGDFRKWKEPENYKQSFERLVDSLHATSKEMT